MWHENLSLVKYGPSTDRPKNDEQIFVTPIVSFMPARKEHNQTSWNTFIARNINGVLKSELRFLNQRSPLSATVNAGLSSFSRKVNFGFYKY